MGFDGSNDVLASTLDSLMKIGYKNGKIDRDVLLITLETKIDCNAVLITCLRSTEDSGPFTRS